MNNRLIIKTGIRLLVLCIGFIITRFPLFSLIGSYDWLRVMMLLSGALICLFSLAGRDLTANAVALSYAITYVAAHYFSTDSYDPGGGRLNNAWLLWPTFHMAATAIAYFLDRMFHVKHDEAGE